MKSCTWETGWKLLLFSIIAFFPAARPSCSTFVPSVPQRLIHYLPLFGLEPSPWRVRHLVLPAKWLRSCPTLCNPSHMSSSIHGILQQEYWSGHALQVIFPMQGLNPASLMSCVMAGGFSLPLVPGKGVLLPPLSSFHPPSLLCVPSALLLIYCQPSLGASSLYLASSSWQQILDLL